ncbi:murinoglobulin-2-like [Penaeus chinensis]|uniref:murinoglobulin-2-like n=1 Tax=Penaeus chinensis TaxID=139456 RepID=UPI001FB82368|nr:murinoglobulin-2-like [Penaeus chinensis]
MQPEIAGPIFTTFYIEVKYQRTPTCEERSKDRDVTIVVHDTILVEAEGFRREQTTTKYVCGSDAAAGLGALENLHLEAPPEAVEGSVSAWVSASSSYMAFVKENMKRLLPHGRGDEVNLFDAANEYMLEAIVSLQEGQEAGLMQLISDNIEEGYKRQLEYRLEDNSYTTLGSRNRSASSWMTAYILAVGAISTNYSVLRDTWSWQAGLQRKESGDGCFDSVGKVYDDLLKKNISGKESRVLNTAYTMISMCISSWGGPPHLDPFGARDCLVQHSSKDPFILAIKAYAISCVQLPDAKGMLKELFLQAVETEKYIYWDLPDDDAESNIEEIRIVSYAALAILRYHYSTFKSELDKMSRWLVEQMNSRGGFYSVFDTMMAMRSLLFFETRQIHHDVSVAVMATNVNDTLHFEKGDQFKFQRVDFPALPTRVNFTVAGSGCAIVQTAVQYTVSEHYQSSAFSLAVTGQWNPSFVCNRPHHLSVCVASPHLFNRTSNLVAVEITLVSGFVPQEEDLEEVVRPSLSVFTQYRYDNTSNKVIFYADGLTAKETCLEFEVLRVFDFEVTKPGVVVVYDYYHPEIALSKSYTLSSSGKCSSVREALNTFRNNAASEGGQHPPADPFSVRIDLPSHAKKGEIIPIRITTESHLDQTLYVTLMLDNTTQYEIVEDASQTAPKEAGERSTCLEARGTNTGAFKIRPLVAEVVNITVGVSVQLQSNSSCEGADPFASDYIYVSLMNITVESDGFTREKTWAKYACGPDIRSGQDTLQDWRIEAPPGAVQGSVKAWLRAASNFMAVIEQNTEPLLLHNRGDIEGLKTAANNYLYINFIGSMRYRNESYDAVLSNVKEGNRHQLQHRLEDDSYAVFGNRNKEVSSWMTSYILTIAALSSQPGITRPTWNWLNTLQRDADNEDGCFDHVGQVYHDGLRNKTTGGISRALLTAYTMVSLGISARDGPPHINPFRARECILQHKSTDPFTLAIKAHALAVTYSDEKNNVLRELFKQATDTGDYIYWDIPNDKSGTNSEAVQTASYVAMAIMTNENDLTFRAELEKVIRWLAAQANSRGGFNSIFDTMMGVRALLYYERRAFEFDVEAKVMAEGVDRTLTFSRDNFRRIQRVDFPILPANVKLDVSGSGCAFLQAVVQYSVNDHYNSGDFSLAVSSSADAKVCGASRINVCTSYLPNRQSNLVAVEVTLVSGYTPLKEDLEAHVSSGNSAFAEYEIKGNKVVLYSARLSAEEACADFGVVRELEVEEAKPGVVVVYDYYQPEIAKSSSYTISPANACT